MYTAKSSTTRFNCWNQESWNTNIDDWSHYRSEHHHHHAYSHAHHHHHHHLQHLQAHQQHAAVRHNHNPHAENHHHHTSLPSSDSSTVNVGGGERHYSEQTASGRISYNAYNNGTNCTNSPQISSNQNPSSNETFGPARIEYCETYPTSTHQYHQEYSYYDQPEACNYTPRQWQSNQNQFSITNSGPILENSSTVPISHQVQAHPSLGHHTHNVHRSPNHQNHPDVVAYHCYEANGQGSVTNVTNNFSVNLALNIPALPAADNSQQATVASTIQYKIQTQLEKRITITPHQLKASQTQANQYANNHSTQTSTAVTPTSTPITKTNTPNLPQESLYTRLKHYRIPKHNCNSKIESHNSHDSNSGQTQGQNICFICGKNYARPSTLKTHLRTHSGEKPYRCHFCGKAFTQAANLTAHIRTHSGEKPFPCPICKRRFSQSSSVTTHLRIHSGERPYLCNYCRKSFSDSSTLTKHLRIHSGEKPYQCRMCTLRFSQSGNLNRHMRVHL